MFYMSMTLGEMKERLEEMIAALQRVLSQNHPIGWGHLRYQENEAMPGVCQCGWIQPTNYELRGKLHKIMMGLGSVYSDVLKSLKDNPPDSVAIEVIAINLDDLSDKFDQAGTSFSKS